jgi:hypothetical protein
LRHNFTTEERAWLDVSLGDATFTVGKPIAQPIKFLNTGKTPAFNVSGYYIFTILNKGDPEPDYSSVDRWMLYVLPRFTFHLITQNQPRWFYVQVIGLSKKSDASKPPSELVPWDTGQYTVQAMPFTEQLREGFEKHESVIVFYGRLTYQDLSHKEHWSTFCSFEPPPAPEALSVSTKCGDYNNTDQD